MRFKNVTTENRNLNQCSVETVKSTTLCKLHYADDMQLYLAFKPGCASSTNDAIVAMERCVNEIRAWMLCDKLKINDGKTEFVIIGTHQQLSKVHVYSLAVGDAQVSPVQSVKNLGTWIDSNMSLQVNLNNTCNAAYYYITNVRLK